MATSAAAARRLPCARQVRFETLTAADRNPGCTAAPNVSAIVELALNAQDFTAAGLTFTHYRPPTLVELSPSTGPSAGATLVRLVATHALHSGVDYRCKFGAPASKTVAASYDAVTGHVLCVAPPLGDAAATGA